MVDRTCTRGDPMSPLPMDLQEHRQLAEELTRQNHPVSDRTVALLLKQSGYSLQANRKTREGTSHPDRNSRFEYINRPVAPFIGEGNLSSRWTRRRRNWWENSRIPVRNGIPQTSPKR